MLCKSFQTRLKLKKMCTVKSPTLKFPTILFPTLKFSTLKVFDVDFLTLKVFDDDFSKVKLFNVEVFNVEVFNVEVFNAAPSGAGAAPWKRGSAAPRRGPCTAAPLLRGPPRAVGGGGRWQTPLKNYKRAHYIQYGRII